MRPERFYPASTWLQRAFCVSKWTVGMGAYAAGWGVNFTASGSWLGLLAWFGCCFALVSLDWSELRWVWQNAREDREDAAGAVPLKMWSVRTRFYTYRIAFYLTLFFSGIATLRLLDALPQLCALLAHLAAALVRVFAWAAVLGPGVPPKDRVLFPQMDSADASA